ncbi:MAG: type II toxin-antitoxin system YafQ family toxin [Chloroflexi bacterium]|nr:type II toxin-antitoxin system YafQ family toxin [Chloroflexota bacterium]
MREVEYSGKFHKDFKRMKKRGVELERLRIVIGKLRRGEELYPHHQDHLLQGRSDPERECHITPDWLLVYVLEDDVVKLVRTGTHADLFK